MKISQQGRDFDVFQDSVIDIVRANESSCSPYTAFRCGATSWTLPKTAFRATGLVIATEAVLEATITGAGEVIQEITAAGGALTPCARQQQTRPIEMHLEHLEGRNIVVKPFFEVCRIIRQR